MTVFSQGLWMAGMSARCRPDCGGKPVIDHVSRLAASGRYPGSAPADPARHNGTAGGS
ncbi:hypothetical protein AGR3A_Cc420201 [Agrobacterium tomkonis CFBP 6623]|uniref:Uncharacterized protein n=1 Tax=Agrobacterium tomkonis CFBP 6623 TaxID=1183432 RepID=A0A1S7QCB8_9HYPH|nr:hypothetical protein AGR3A_Cc420201 [Agrobacterium tomkonis CFBP 6623]